MREIKFRAWNRKSKVMTYLQEGVSFVLSLGGLWKFTKPDPDMSSWCNEMTGELMQCTGLKDKNGKKIYEGDIVVGNNTKKLEIIWFPEKATFAIRYDSNGEKCFEEIGNALCEHALKELEVIGNIYENPELMEMGE